MPKELFIELYEEFTQTQSSKTEEELQKEPTTFEIDFNINSDDDWWY